MWLLLLISPTTDPVASWVPYLGPFAACAAIMAGVIAYLVRQLKAQTVDHKAEIAAKDQKIDAAQQQTLETMRECIALATRMTQQLSELAPQLARILEAMHDEAPPRRRA